MQRNILTDIVWSLTHGPSSFTDLHQRAQRLLPLTEYVTPPAMGLWHLLVYDIMPFWEWATEAPEHRETVHHAKVVRRLDLFTASTIPALYRRTCDVPVPIVFQGIPLSMEAIISADTERLEMLALMSATMTVEAIEAALLKKEERCG